MDEQGVSQRELARRLCELGGGQMNGRRRQIIRWLNGETANPGRPTRIKLAEALGYPGDHFLAVPSPADATLARLDELEEAQGRLEQELESVLRELRGDADAAP